MVNGKLYIYIYMILQYLETIPSRTSGKIELTPPAYSQATVLLVYSLNFGLLT